MKLMTMINKFKADESGAVTVDWVVLTASMVALGLIVGSAVSTSVTGLGDKITTEINKMEVLAVE
jgi:Flp pilus assembly pilin Flp